MVTLRHGKAARTIPHSPLTAGRYRSLQKELEEMKERLSELERKMGQEKVVVLRDISRDEAKQEIRDLFASGASLYYSDIAHESGIPLRIVVEICNELEKEGEIGPDAGIRREG